MQLSPDNEEAAFEKTSCTNCYVVTTSLITFYSFVFYLFISYVHHLPRDWWRREPFADVGRCSFWATENPSEKPTDHTARENRLETEKTSEAKNKQRRGTKTFSGIIKQTKAKNTQQKWTQKAVVILA